jgi:hypothetical protein
MPYEGARFIWREIADEIWPGPPELSPFIGNASEYEDCQFYSEHPEEIRAQIDADTRSEAWVLSERLK